MDADPETSLRRGLIASVLLLVLSVAAWVVFSVRHMVGEHDYLTALASLARFPLAALSCLLSVYLLLRYRSLRAMGLIAAAVAIALFVLPVIP